MRYSRKRHKIESITEDKSPYEILEIEETASFKDIKKAYLAKVKLSPPEKDPEGFKAIRKAYGLLKDRAKRKELDFSIFRTKFDQDVELTAVSDISVLFKDRVFQLLLSSSDFYIKDFSSHFQNIDEDIRNLR